MGGIDMAYYCEELTGDIIASAIEVHKQLGPGLLESAYEQCLKYELALRKLKFRSQLSLPLEYKGIRLDCAYRLDLSVEEKVVIEIKAVEKNITCS